MIKRNLTWITIVGLASLVVVAMVAQRGSSSAPDGGTGIPPQAPELVAAGDLLYLSSCAACHGVDLRGTSTGPSHLSVVYEPNHHGDFAFVSAARNGVRQHHWPFGDMEAVPGLSDEDLEAIVAYVRETQRVEGFEPYPP